MFPNIQQYMKMKYGPKQEVVEVAEKEFIECLMRATGISQEDAKFQADMSIKMGAATQVGDRLLKVI